MVAKGKDKLEVVVLRPVRAVIKGGLEGWVG